MTRPLLPLLALLALVLAFFGPSVAAGLLLAPGDGLGYYFPIRVAAAEAWRAGELPFWNPYAFGGTPLMASLQGGVFYPGNWFFALLPPVAAMNATVIAAYAVAGGAMYAFTRAVERTRLAAFLAALAFMGGGYMVAHLEHVTMLQAGGLVCALLWAVEKLRATGKTRYAIAFACLLGLQVLAGYPQTVVQGMLIVGPYALWRAWSVEGARRKLALVASLAGAGALGLGLAAMQLLPTADLLAESQRQAMPYSELISHSLPPAQLLTLFFPYLFGGFPSGLFPTPYWGAGPWLNELTGYMGLGTLLLAVAAIFGWRKEPAIRFWAIIAVFALLLALGGFTPLYKLWAQLPLLKIMRVPGRHLLELNLALAVLAAYGLDGLVRAADAERRRMAIAAWTLVGLPVLAVLVGVAVAGGKVAAKLQPYMPPGTDLHAALRLDQAAFWLPAAFWALSGLALWAVARKPETWRLGALVAVLLVDLAIFGQHQGWRVIGPQAGQVPAAATAPGEARVLAVSATGYPFYDPALAFRLRYGLLGGLWHERAAHGYEPLLKSRYAQILSMSHGGALGSDAVWKPGHHALDVLHVRQVRLEPSLVDVPAWRTRLDAPRWRPLGNAEFENTRALPRAWRVEFSTLSTPDWIADRMGGAGAFDPRREALLEKPLTAAGLTGGTATASAPSPNRLRLETSGEGPGMVVLSESYDPGWRAFLGDRQLPVHRVDGLVLGVEVPAGTLAIDWHYEPVRWKTGLGLSMLSAFLLVAWGLFARWRRSRVSSAG